MRDDWAMDILDFQKYALARTLLRDGGLKVGICSMMTAPSYSALERPTPFYLKDPEKRWRNVDPELYDWFDLLVSEGHRSTRTIHELGIVPATTFYLPRIPARRTDRHDYFNNCWGHMRGNDVCFYDPDTGLVPGCTKSRASETFRSRAHLYYDEVAATYQQAFSVIVFQHYDRTPRPEFISTKANLLKSHTHAPVVISFVTPHVMFLCAPQAQMLDKIEGLIDSVLERWSSTRFLKKKRALEILTH